MGYTPYFVGPLKVGLEKDMDSYLIPEDAYPTLENAYLWRGRNYKKGGTQILGRLGVRTDTLAVRGAPPQTYAANTLWTPIEPGTLVITDGITTFTDNGLGVMVVTSGLGNPGTINYTTGAYSVTFTGVNAGATVTASYIVVVNANSPCMGLRTYEVIYPANHPPQLIAFDMVNAYFFDNPTNTFFNISYYKIPPGQTTGPYPVTWTGTNSQFFYTVNYQEAFFATNGVPGGHFYAITNTTNATPTVITIGPHNFVAGDIVYINNLNSPGNTLNGNTLVITAIGANTITVNAAGGAYGAGGVAWEQTKSKAGAGDGIRWYDGFGWVNFAPPLDPSGLPDSADQTGVPQILMGALLLFPYKGFFVALNTYEGTTFANKVNYQNRARWSNPGNVFFSPKPVPSNNAIVPPPTGQEWDETEFGGHLDAPTNEAIIAAEFIKDTLVVYFERSTYKLTSTGDLENAFIWEKINTEIGCESTFSTIAFDRGILTVAQNGIYVCDSINIDRIDRIIPDEVFGFQNNTNGIQRIYGIRDFFNEMAYWTYVDSNLNVDNIITTFPNRTLIYNYLTTSWSIFKNSFTCFGSYQFIDNLQWQTATKAWQIFNRAWNASANRVNFPAIVAGNQQGFVQFLESSDGDFFATNDISLKIQNISNATPYSVFTVVNHNLDVLDTVIISNTNGTVGINGNTYLVATVPTNDTFTLSDSAGNPVQTSTWTFGGNVSIVDNFNITTKNLNPYFPEGRSMRLGYVDLFLENIDPPAPPAAPPAIHVELYLDDDTDDFIEERDILLTDITNIDNEKFWTRIYFQSQGQFLSLKFSYNPETQIYDQNSTSAQVVIHGMVLWMKPTGRMLNVG